MHLSKDRLLAFLLLCALVCSTLPASARQEQHTRPRRVNPESSPPAVPGKQPFVRVGLATDARSVTLSTAGKMLYAETTGAAPALLEAARVRVEPRMYPQLTPPTIDESDASSPNHVASSNRIASPNDAASSKPASSARAPVIAAGGRAKSQQKDASEAAPGASQGNVRLTSRVLAPTRGAAVFAVGEESARLDARGPVVFSSTDEERDPVRFNDKPYRGRVEVFPNARGTLTVVNLLPLEEYVRGVVPNELSPGGWPELEALKAQAVAARTYAISNAGGFKAEGFDLLPTTRSQVYGGRSTEHPLTDRAVAETHGVVATYAGRPINALYTSTCGGRTEHAEEIFGGERVPYLRSRECAVEAAHPFESFALRTSRELPQVRSTEHAESARDAALLATHGFRLPARLGDEWLAAPLASAEAREMLSRVATLARPNNSASNQTPSSVGVETTRPAEFASALVAALDGESRGAALLNSADVEYLLSFRDAGEVPEKHRADVALLLREGVLELYPDATLRPRQSLTRARALGLVSAALAARGLLRLHKATARPTAEGALVLRPASGKGANRTLKLATDAFLFRAFGASLYPAREVFVVGGEPVVYHLNATGEVDYLEVSPAPSGAASDRFSQFAVWSETMTPAVLLSRLGRAASGVGTLLDVHVRRRGASGRVLDLEVTGTRGTAHVKGGRIRSALELREQLFVVERDFDEEGRIVRFTFAGRGWGHGVGMCQVGAYGLARSGYDYERILKSYYTGISLTKLY
jgi:stage II sporulation protein D